jgi:TfoX/Sxy family transcriptional regulator of competence genes
MAYDEKLAERVRAALANRDDVVEKRMFGGIAFMVRGHMSCGIVSSTLMVRLAPADADRLMNAPHVRPMDFTGRPMRGFLYVDPPGTKTAATLRQWVERATAYGEAQPVKARSQAGPKRKRLVGKR